MPRPSAAPANTLRQPNLAPADPNETILHPVDNVVEQLEYDAAARHREDLVGLSWQQGDHTYVVSSRDVFVRQFEDHVNTTRLPRLHKGAGGRANRDYTQQKDVRDMSYLERRKDYQTTDYYWKRFTVDVYDADGELVEIKALVDDSDKGRQARNHKKKEHQFAGKNELFDYLNSHDNSDPSSSQHIEKFTWLDVPKTPPHELPPHQRNTIPVPVHGNKNLFGQALQHQRTLKDRGDGRFDDLVGLTWEQNDKKKGDLTHQVTRDTLLLVKDANGERYERVLFVKAYDSYGYTQERRVRAGSALEEYFDAAEKDGGQPLQNLRWEIPANQPNAYHPTQLAWAGWLAARSTTAPGGPGLHLTETRKARHRKRARNLLSGHDVFGPVEAQKFMDKFDTGPGPRASLHQRLLHKRRQKFVQSLADVMNEIGMDGVHDLAKDLRDSYVTSVERLGLGSPSDSNYSVSRILWSLAEQRYYADNPNHALKRYLAEFGPYRVGPGGAPQLIDPFDRQPASIQQRREMVDRMVASDFALRAFNVERTPRRVVTKKDVGMEIDESFHLKPEIEQRLKGFGSDTIMEALAPVLKDGQDPHKLNAHELNVLGRALREAVLQ